MATELFRSYSLEKSKNSNNDVVTSGSLTLWKDTPVSPFDVGDTFQPVNSSPVLTVEKVSIKDNVVGLFNGKPVRQWEVTVEGSDETSASSTTHVKYNFNISASEKSGTMEVTNTGETPSVTIQLGANFTVPGIGQVKCVNIKGNDEYDDNGNHIWSVVYEGSDKTETLPQNTYNFNAEFTGKDANGNALNVYSGSLQSVNEGDTPTYSYHVGDTFSVPGFGVLTCTKVSGGDEYTEAGVRRWTVTYEGRNEQNKPVYVKYNFNIASDEKSGTMEITNTGNAPSVTIGIGDTFSVPGVGSVKCVNVKGNDEYDDNGNHIWTVVYEGSDKTETLPPTSYNLSFERDSSGELQKTGRMQVVQTGATPPSTIQVGSTFNVPGVGNLTCTKVSGNDDYTETGTHRWTMVYEGVLGSSDNPDDPDTPTANAKYTFSKERDAQGNTTQSGTVEISNTGANPSTTYALGSTITLPGVGSLTCTKISGADTYTDKGLRKWIVTYEGSDATQTDPDNPTATTKYTLDIENNADGITVYTGTKEITCTGEAPTISISVGGTFSVPYVGNLTCTRVHSSNDGNTWTVIIEGSRGGSSSDDPDDPETPSMPENETVINYELNGITVRTVAGEFLALRRSETPITKKSVTVYTNTVTAVASPGSTYEGGTVLSENIVKETIKSNGVVTGSYYKHTLEVEL